MNVRTCAASMALLCLVMSTTGCAGDDSALEGRESMDEGWREQASSLSGRFADALGRFDPAGPSEGGFAGDPQYVGGIGPFEGDLDRFQQQLVAEFGDDAVRCASPQLDVAGAAVPSVDGSPPDRALACDVETELPASTVAADRAGSVMFAFVVGPDANSYLSS